MNDPADEDDALAALLRRSRSPHGVAEARRILEGLAAAPLPPSDRGESWTVLIAPQAEPGDRAALARMRAALAASLAAPPPDAAAIAGRLARLRDELGRRGLAGFVVPRADEHQGEYVPLHAQRLTWITGFTGSAGLAVILSDRAALFVDGRYTLQARDQAPADLFDHRHSTENPPAEWLAAALPAGGILGYDPWLHTEAEIARLADGCRRAGGELRAESVNPVDAIWTNRPPPPLAPVVPHDLRFAGRSAADKRHRLGADLRAKGADAAVLTAPDSIAWLLNIRGGDVAHTPLPLSFAIAEADGRVALFVDRRKLVPGLTGHLGDDVRVEPPESLGAALDRLGADGRRVLVDPTGTAAWVLDRLTAAGARIVRGQDPCALPKACKNDVELDGARAAHRRDAVALVRFLAWVAREAPAGRLTELAAEARLLALRRELDRFRDTSFPTISGAGPNGAIVHYRATPATDRRLEPGSLYLVDSGAQFLDGTTDVTRTVAVGQPSEEQREAFTRVLQGHIALATARFPKGTTGSQLDVLARHALWQTGRDFDHGTGHGIGSYLGVHEGPQRISKLPNATPLLPGMIVSNEPGYYRAGAYGIRIENLLAVRVCAPLAAAEREMLDFETLTLAPIDRALVEPALLSAEERAWLDGYHARVREAIAADLDGQTADWLDEATRPLSA